MKEKYVCSICGKRNVKLWRPNMDDDSLLICAESAEKIQVKQEYSECVQHKVNGLSISFAHEKKLLQKWTVDNEGNIPYFPGMDMHSRVTTTRLNVDLSNISDTYPPTGVTIIPAIYDENGNFLNYTSISEELFNQWKALPTR